MVSLSSQLSLSELTDASRRKASGGVGTEGNKLRELGSLADRDDLRLLNMRLSLLSHLQRDLEVQVGPGSIEINLTPSSPLSNNDATPSSENADVTLRRPNQEFAVRTSRIDALATLRTRMSLGPERKLSEERHAEMMGRLAGCAADMEALWADAGVRALLGRRGVRIEDEGGL